MQNSTQLDLSILLPQMEAGDKCVKILTARLSQQRGIEKAHIVRENGSARLCLHYDPNLVPLATVERLAHEAGAEISQRYRHEQIPFARLNTADAALSLEKELRQLLGMIHASVNYAAGLIFVAYDNTILKREKIESVIRGMGAKIVYPPLPQRKEADHGGAPAFLPHWMQERWTLILVALAAAFF